MKQYLIGIDNGGSTTKAAVFDLKGREIISAGRRIPLIEPCAGRVERDLNEVWKTNAELIKEVIHKAGIDPQEIAGLGLTGYENGICLLDRDGNPVYNGIVSSDNRAADLSGDSLHKRGYRLSAGKAPISETLAAALIMLTPWRKERILVDPFCGSGTFPIEAAMMAANIAPGMNRSFTAESWANLIDKKLWYEAIDEANDLIDDQIETDIQGYDIDGDVVRMARQNAENAGVDHLIHFQERPVSALSHPKKYGFIITNPPYGERLEEKEALPGLYREFGESFRKLDSWSAYMITSYEDAERYFGRKADKNRKIYNGMLKTYFYQFQGPKPPRPKK